MAFSVTKQRRVRLLKVARVGDGHRDSPIFSASTPVPVCGVRIRSLNCSCFSPYRLGRDSERGAGSTAHCDGAAADGCSASCSRPPPAASGRAGASCEIHRTFNAHPYSEGVCIHLPETRNNPNFAWGIQR